MNKNCTKDSEINELSEDEENVQEDIGSHQHFSDESCDGAIAAQTVTSMPLGFMRQYPISTLEGTKSNPQAPPPVISNGHRAILGELLTTHENPLPSIRTLEHGLKETS